MGIFQLMEVVVVAVVATQIRQGHVGIFGE